MKAILVVALALLLGACGGEEFGDLKSELKDKTKDLRGRIEPLPVVKPYEPVPYKVFDQPDPFSSAKIELVTKSASTGGGGLKPDLNRPKEPLEAYPLESLKMVGVLQQRKANFALVKADTGLYRVKVGQYLGQNFGLVTAITDSQVQLRELIQDAVGDWTERQSTLQLLEVGGGR
ncbi:MAG: pilus assembly protein PilP [Betaproteobacteria bacterium]|nr:MAG: pilus assembly protein PilP [Betaproteobacteria bacterium]